MPDYERRFIQAKTKPRKEVLNNTPIVKVEKISKKTFAFNKIIYRHYVVTRSDHKIYEFNDNDLVNLNPYDLTILYAYCSARYDSGRREIRMSLVEVRRAMEAYIKHRAKRYFQIALNLGEEKLGVTEPVETIDSLDQQKAGSIIEEPMGFIYRVNQEKKIFLASQVEKYSDETLKGIQEMIHVKQERHRADLLAKLDLEIGSMINFRELIMKATLKKASLSLKSVQSQTRESCLSLKSVQRVSGKTSESSSSEILVQSSEDDHSETLDKEEQMTRHLIKSGIQHKAIELPKQISTLEDLHENERKYFQEKKKTFDIEKKNFEKKNTGIFKEISEKNKNLEKEFKQERQIFESEISKLTSKLSVLSSDILKQQKCSASSIVLREFILREVKVQNFSKYRNAQKHYEKLKFKNAQALIYEKLKRARPWRDCAIMYMAEIPAIEAERDKLKTQNSKLLNQIKELNAKFSNYEKTSECGKCINNSKSDFSELKAESVDLRQKFKAFVEKISALEAKNADLMKTLNAGIIKGDLEKIYIQKISDFSKKAFQEKKDLELRCLKLSKQVSEFEKIVITERDNFAKERKVLKDKSIEFPKKISTLQDLLENERKVFQKKKKSFDVEKKNVGIFKEISKKNKNLENDFEQERQIFESEISKLTSKIYVLSSDIQKEQMARSDLKKKFDTLSDERNILSEKIKQLEVANVELSEKISADVINQSPYDNSTKSIFSFKTATNSIHENVFKRNSVKSNIVKSNQIRLSNLFYYKSIDSPASFYVKSLEKNFSKKGQIVWRVKGSPDDKKNDKSKAKNNAHKGKSFGKPDMFYSANHLIRIAQKKICCSYCGENDFVQKEYAHHWYKTYRITSQKSKLKSFKSNEKWIPKSNQPGPKYQWVAKPVKSVLQVP
ncbi:hypothetical protein L6452_15223 [Arctium lappa]|uniref:Uncharacterized protein n=1 Tax=Arctium lappa TaxID=4217 RepID=A0ACB9CMZ5_ARCLA|nr:hypothetical protein L6452_15223 [Arctium lappa]